MTISELRSALARLEAAGHGSLPVRVVDGGEGELDLSAAGVAPVQCSDGTRALLLDLRAWWDADLELSDEWAGR